MADDHLMKVDNDDVDYNVLCERLVNKGVISEQDKQQIQGKPATEQKEFIISKAVAAGQDSIEEYINCLEELKTEKGKEVMKQPDGRIIKAVREPRDGVPDKVGVAFSDGVKVYVFTPWQTELSGLEAVKPVYFKIQYENGDVKFAERGQLIIRCQELNACIHHVTGVSVQSIRRGPMVVDVTSDTDDVIHGKAVLLINRFMWSGDGERHEFHGHTAVPVPQGHTAVAVPSHIEDMEVMFRDKTTVKCQSVEKCRSCECLKFQLDPTRLPEHLKLQLLSTLSWKVGSTDVRLKHKSSRPTPMTTKSQLAPTRSSSRLADREDSKKKVVSNRDSLDSEINHLKHNRRMHPYQRTEEDCAVDTHQTMIKELTDVQSINANGTVRDYLVPPAGFKDFNNNQKKIT